MDSMPHRIYGPRRQGVARRPGFDPQTQPVVPASQVLPALLPSTLQLDFICSAFGRAVDWQVEPIFADSFRSDFSDCKDIIRAAVLIPLVQRPDGLHVIFTRRSSHLHDHAGQISFPGGRIEPFDRDAVAAAVRETQEEIGVEPQYLKVIGTQPGYLTSTRFTMLPVIGQVLPGFSIHPDSTEVAEVFEVPLPALMDPAGHVMHRAQLPGGGHRLYFSIPWGPYFIWGATAALIRNLYHFLAAAQNTPDRS
ncbi:8-oxo-dGTP pyrophosphatase MutT (NUDIX family) [Paralcaligenes ureilyticus]|uniref:8-oxo-dGTP pyrophosphatase MutT (NUDIX family) n=2 Tax=Paralcaligenes ureilyticus TaxID=627131 RepID=A0A4R3M3A2_9BURK|nr:8-oxo-dGTP pyrophosphatase MutT (NUDIX family) [Paralcaligenes ureilyticus]